jgi:hypothetical protein
MRNLKNHAPRKGVETLNQQGAELVWKYSVILPIPGKSETEYSTNQEL